MQFIMLININIPSIIVGLLTFILAWEFVTRSCLKPQNPRSNHEIRVLFEHGFNLKKPELNIYACNFFANENIGKMISRGRNAFQCNVMHANQGPVKAFQVKAMFITARESHDLNMDFVVSDSFA